MKLAVMQPYFLPYLGYWQLIRSVDRFVVFDDVAYIKRGWVNRNRLLIQGAPHYFTAPVRDASQNRRICDTRLAADGDWRGTLVRTVETAYRRAPHFDRVFPVVEALIRHDTDDLAAYLAHQLQTLAAFMRIETPFISSRAHDNAGLAGQARILDFCARESADSYHNLPGGMALYDAADFARAGIALRFVAMRPQPYPQRSPGFVPGLSIVDALMELGPDGIQPYLDACDVRAATPQAASA